MSARAFLKKAGFALVPALLLFGALETAARAYVYFRAKNSAAFTYGAAFLLDVLQGKDFWKAQFPFRDPKQLENMTEQAFVTRNSDRAPALVEGDPAVVLNMGQAGRRNRFGYRGEDFSLEPPAGVTRIVTLGGSDVFGAGLTDELTWPRLLQQSLNENTGRYDVVNLGVMGANIHDVLVTLIKVAGHMTIDYAVVVSAFNNQPLLRMEPHFTLARKVDFYLYNVSMLHVIVKEKLSLLSGQSVDFALYSRRVHVDPTELKRWVDMYRLRLEQANTVCREHGIRLVLVAQPYVFYDREVSALNTLDERAVAQMEAKILWQPDVREMELAFYLQGRQNIEMEHFAAERDALFFDGVHVYPTDLKPFFFDQIHPRPEGSKRFASAMAKFFATLASDRQSPRREIVGVTSPHAPGS